MEKQSTYYALPGEKTNAVRQEMILKLLREKPCCREEILEYLSKVGFEISRDSLKKDLGTLRKSGYEIHSRKGLISITEDRENEKYLLHPRKYYRDATAQFLLLKALQDKPLKYAEMPPLGITEYFMRRNVLNPLKADGLVLEEKGKIYKNTAPFRILDLPDEDTLFYLLSHRIKLTKRIFDVTIKRLAFDEYIDTERDKSILYDMPSYISALKKVDYTKKPIAFSYRGSKGQIHDVDFFLVGIVAYSAAKDEIYLLGRTAPKKETYKMVKAASIDWNSVKVSPQIKNYYKDAEKDPMYLDNIRSSFEQMKSEMFVISPDSKEYVEVLVKYSEERMKAFLHLAAKRNITASIEIVENGDFIYRDTIRGMSDFAKYLRGFGSAVTVIKDKRLQKQMITTAEEVLKNYGEV